MSRHHNNLGFGPCKGCILFQSTIAGAVRMSAFYRNSSCATPARVMSPAAAVNGDDEEIAYQLQLEALAESLAPNHKASTPLQASYSSSSTRNSSEQQSGADFLNFLVVLVSTLSCSEFQCELALKNI